MEDNDERRKKIEFEIQLYFLDLRYFLDDALKLIETFASNEKNITGHFQKDADVIGHTRTGAIEYTRTMIEIKKYLTDYDPFNKAMSYSNTFQNQRERFFKVMFQRLINLNDKIERLYLQKENLMSMYFDTLRLLVRNTNELIGYLETVRWNRDVAFELIDKLVETCNNFSAIFEKFVQLTQISSDDSFEQPKKSYPKRTVRNKQSPVKISTDENEISSIYPIRETPIKNSTKAEALNFNSKRNENVSCFYFSILVIFLLLVVCLIILLFNYSLDLFDYSLSFFGSSSNSKLSQLAVRNSIFFDSIRVFEMSSSLTIDLNSIYFWTQVYDYISDMRLIMFCFFFYILFEYIVCRKIL